MTLVWGVYQRGKLESVTENYDAPANEIVEVRDTYGVPAGIPGLTEQLIFNNVKSGVESNGGVLTYCEVTIDWLAFQTRVIYQYRSPGLLVAIIVTAVVLLIVFYGFWLIFQSFYRVVGPVGATLLLLAIVIFGSVILVSVALPLLLPVAKTAKRLIS